MLRGLEAIAGQRARPTKDGRREIAELGLDIFKYLRDPLLRSGSRTQGANEQGNSDARSDSHEKCTARIAANAFLRFRAIIFGRRIDVGVGVFEIGSIHG